MSYSSLGDMLEKGEYPFQASHGHSLGKIMENTYMLHVVCTGYCLWLFSLIARHSSKIVLIFEKKIMGRKTFLVSVIFSFGGIVTKSWQISRFYVQSDEQ